MLMTKRKARKMSLDQLLASVDYETADLFIRFYSSLLPYQKAGFKAIMRKQIGGDYAQELARNTAIEAEVCEDEANG